MIIRTQSASAAMLNPTTLTDLLRYRAVLQPNRLAYTFLKDGEVDAVPMTYGELDRLARAIGAQLQDRQAMGERILLLYPAGLEYIAAFFGCLYAGAVAVPAYPPHFNRSIERLQAIVTDAQATVALTTTSILSKVAAWREQAIQLAAMQWIDTHALAAGCEDSWQEPGIDADTLAFLQYTSGSTAKPKGVMISHGNLLSNLRMIQRVFQNTDQSIGVSWLPLYHDMGLIGSLLQPLHRGFPCILMSPMAFLQRPYRWLQAISRYQATGSGGPNFAYDLCVRKITPAQRASLDLRSWVRAFSGAEPVRQDTLERFAATFAPCGFQRQAFRPCYGLAEATLIVSGGQITANPVVHTVQKAGLEQHHIVTASADEEDTQTLVSCGRPLLQERIIIVDPVTRTPCSSDQVGEIWVANPSVAQGYWNRPEETTHTFEAYLADTGDGPFLRTGDLGYLHHGELFVTGRLKDLLIIHGSNHYPQDIEMTVERSHPSLRPGCGAAFSVEMAGEERLVIAQEVERRVQPPRPHHPERRRVVPEPGFDPECPRLLDVDTIIGNICQAVAEQHSIQPYVVLLLRAGSIPKTSSGKIQRYACRAQFVAGKLEVIAEWRAPSGSGEPMLKGEESGNEHVCGDTACQPGKLLADKYAA